MKIMTAIMVGAVVAFVWSAVSWMVLPWHNFEMKTFSQGGQIVAEALRMEAPESGIYLVPNMDEADHGDQEKEQEWQEKAKAGPFAYLSVRPHGVQFNMGPAMFVQFLTQVLVAAMLVWLLKGQGGTALNIGFRASVIVSAGAIFAHLPYWNWWGFPAVATMVNIADTALGWFFAGLAISKWIGRQTG